MPGVSVTRVTQGPLGHFFGYYDKCPWDLSGHRLLAHQVHLDSDEPDEGDPATIGIIRLDDNNRFEPIADTRAWNFQQGAMLQWHPKDPNRFVIFNDIREGRFVTRVIDLINREESTLDRPVAAVSPDGRYGYSLNFSRLQDLRPGYGYPGVPDVYETDACPESDGIYRIDFESGESELLVSMSDVAAVGKGSPGSNTMQWLNVLLVNPDSSRVCFVHRWTDEFGGLATRLMAVCADGSDLRCVEDGGYVSHFDWKSPTELLAWTRRQSDHGGSSKRRLLAAGSLPILQSPPLSWAMDVLRKSVIPWVRQKVVGDRFALYNLDQGDLKEIGVGALPEDGHCSYSPDQSLILMDTYPREARQAKLLLYDESRDIRIDIGRFYSPPRYTGPVRCDLHACWSRDGRQICIDSTHEGSRQIYIIDIGRALMEGPQV
jgi:hypothetical protein